LNGYGLIPVGDVEQKLNSVYNGGAMNTYGLDAGYFITPVLKASVGYYYQHRDQEDVDGSGVRGRLAYEISNGLTAGVNVSYDEAFDTRISTDIKVRFGGAATTAQRKAVQQLPVINALTATPSNRDVRVHDWGCPISIKECRDLYYVQSSEGSKSFNGKPAEGLRIDPGSQTGYPCSDIRSCKGSKDPGVKWYVGNPKNPPPYYN
jgi:hypothetical protein